MKIYRLFKDPFHEYCRSLQGLSNVIAFVFLKILHSLISTQKSLFANNFWNKQNYKNCLILPNWLIKLSVYGYFLDWTFPRLTLLRGKIPNWHFPDQILPRRRLPWPNISPLRHFLDRTFPWQHVLVRYFLKKFVSNPFWFVCTSIY